MDQDAPDHLSPRASQGPTTRRSRGRRTLWSALVACPLLIGCQSTPPAEPSATPPAEEGTTSLSAPPSSAPSPERPPAAAPANDPAAAAAYAQAVARQALRLRRLQFLESNGVVEIRWRDAKGRHFEQGDLTLYSMPPWKTALNISKAGERLMWIGSDEAQWWLFSFLDKPSTVSVRTWNDNASLDMSVVSPRAFLHLSGLTALPDPATVSVRMLPDGKRLQVEGRPPPLPTTEGGEVVEQRMRWTIDAATGFPAEIELLADDGTAIARSTLSEYISAEIDGAPPGDFPKVPRRIVVVRCAGATEADGAEYSLSISLDGPSGRGQRIKPRFFRLPELMETFRPDEVYVSVPSADQAPPTPLVDPQPAPAGGPQPAGAGGTPIPGKDAPPASPLSSPPGGPPAGPPDGAPR